MYSIGLYSQVHSIMCGYFCNGFIDFMLNNKRLRGLINSFYPKDSKINDKIMLKHFQ